MSDYTDDFDRVDVIGDVHGHADALRRLLLALGYSPSDGTYRHPTRTVVFAGDFIDRGPHQREVLSIARKMVQAGSALAVMGNHEFNAIGWATSDRQGGFLRARVPKNHFQHRAFLDQIGGDSEDHDDAVAWFKSLPLWLELEGLRVVHACWHATSQKVLESYLDAENRLTQAGLHEVYREGCVAFRAAEILLKGPEARLPSSQSFTDEDGHVRHDARLRWWDPTATTFRTATLGMEGREPDLPEVTVPREYFYSDETPVLFGHYWMRGRPRILNPKASCLDFSVANAGFLTAYRWSGEPNLTSENLVWVPA